MSNIVKFSNYDIEALVDNELSKRKYEDVLILLEHDQEAYQTYKALFRQKLLLKQWWKNQQKS